LENREPDAFAGATKLLELQLVLLRTGGHPVTRTITQDAQDLLGDLATLSIVLAT